MQRPTNNQFGILVVCAVATSVMLLVYFMLIGGYGFLSAVVVSLILALLVALLIYLFLMTGHGAELVGQASTKSSAAFTKASANIAEKVLEAKQKAQEKAKVHADSVKATGVGAAMSPADTSPDPSQDEAEAVSKTAPEARSEPPAKAEETGEASQPKGLVAPPESGADDLTKIKGVGPKLAAVLNDMGYFSFDQIANWSEAEIAWIDENLGGFKGRASRDNWVGQAKSFASDG